jgi:WD40 repeat protein
VTLSFPAWKEGQVVPTRHELAIVKGATRHPILPASPELTWTIRPAEKQANISHQKYSPDGKRLFLAGYPSGIAQFWDLENRKEIRRMESHKGYRGSSDYAHLTPDWKTLYVGEETRKVTQIEDQGKNVRFFENTGKVLVWDAETGEQKSSLYPASGYGAGYCQMSPDGRKLVLVEMKSYKPSEVGKTTLAQTSVWDLKTQERRLLGDAYMVPNFSSDSKFGYFSITNYDKKTSIIKKIDLDTGKTLAEFDCGEQNRHLSLQGVSPDDRWLAVKLAGKLAAPPTTLFLDTADLKEKGRLVLAPDPKSYGWQSGSYSPDGKLFETSDGLGNIHLWSLEEKKVIRVIPMENTSGVRSFSPDGRYLAIAWMPKYDESLDDAREPEPADMPQPRISLIDLKDAAKAPFVLVAPHGYCGSLAFRPDGKQLAFGSWGAVHIFDIEKLIKKKEKP